MILYNQIRVYSPPFSLHQVTIWPSRCPVLPHQTPRWTPGWRLQAQLAAFEQWHVTGVLATCGQIMELSQDHPVALILSQMARACLFPLPAFLPPIMLFNRIMTLTVKQPLSGLAFRSQPREPCYWCRRLSMWRHQRKTFGAGQTRPCSCLSLDTWA